MMTWLREHRPGVTEAMASNADNNFHMVDINKRLGYQIVRTMISVEKPVGELAARLGT
jgi:hypothetical protein